MATAALALDPTLKATGPRTPEGKARSAQNALRHGFRSPQLVLAVEDQEAYDEHLAAFQHEHAPATPTERHWVEQLAVADWKVQRLELMEAAWLNLATERLLEEKPELGTLADAQADPRLAARLLAMVTERETRHWDRYQRYGRDLRRQFDRALKSLAEARKGQPPAWLQAATSAPPQRASEPAPAPVAVRTNEPTAAISTNEPQTPHRRLTPKVGRNAQCPCGSGVKHKRCCGA